MNESSRREEEQWLKTGSMERKLLLTDPDLLRKGGSRVWWLLLIIERGRRLRIIFLIFDYFLIDRWFPSKPVCSYQRIISSNDTRGGSLNFCKIRSVVGSRKE